MIVIFFKCYRYIQIVVFAKEYCFFFIVINCPILRAHKFGFEHHAAEAVDFAVDVVVGAGDEADIFHFGALLDALAAAFRFKNRRSKQKNP